MKQIYCIPKLEQLDKFEDFSKEYDAGFEYNDFFIPAVLDQPQLVQNLIDTYKALDRDRSEDTLHGVFLDMCVHSSDARIYEATDFRIHQSMDIATALGVKAIIFHTNHIPNFRLKSYREEWVSRNEHYWRNLLAEYPTLTVYMENMFDEEPELLLQLSERMKDEPRFAVCLDFPHAFISCTSISDWCSVVKPYIRHLHINDNAGVEDTHHPVGSGALPWDVYNDYLSGLTPAERPSVLIEVRTFEDLMESVQYMKQHAMYPFA